MFHLRCLILLLGLLVAPASLSEPIAESIVRNFGKATTAYDWQEVVKYYSSPDLIKFREAFKSLLDTETSKQIFFPNKSSTEIDKLSDTEFVASILGKFARLPGISIKIEPPMLLGSVKENSKMIHVVAKRKIIMSESKASSVVYITTVKKIDDRWYISVADDFDNIIAFLKNKS